MNSHKSQSSLPEILDLLETYKSDPKKARKLVRERMVGDETIFSRLFLISALLTVPEIDKKEAALITESLKTIPWSTLRSRIAELKGPTPEIFGGLIDYFIQQRIIPKTNLFELYKDISNFYNLQNDGNAGMIYFNERISGLEGISVAQRHQLYCILTLCYFKERNRDKTKEYISLCHKIETNKGINPGVVLHCIKSFDLDKFFHTHSYFKLYMLTLLNEVIPDSIDILNSMEREIKLAFKEIENNEEKSEVKLSSQELPSLRLIQVIFIASQTIASLNKYVKVALSYVLALPVSTLSYADKLEYCIQAKDTEQVLECYSHIQSNNESCIKIAGYFFDKGDIREALAYLNCRVEQIQQSDLLNKNSLSNLYAYFGYILQAYESYVAAKYYLDLAIEINPNNTEAFTNRYLVLIALNEPKKARFDFKQVKSLDPENKEIDDYKNKFTKTQKLPDSEKSKKPIRNKPDNISTAGSDLIYYLGNHEYEKAKATLLHILKLRNSLSQTGNTQSGLADICLMQKDYKQALIHAEIAANYIDPHINADALMTIYRNLQQYDKAGEQAFLILNHWNNDYALGRGFRQNAYFALCDIFINIKYFTQGALFLTDLLNNNELSTEEKHDLHHYIAHLYINDKNLQLAAYYAKEAIKLSQNNKGKSDDLWLYGSILTHSSKISEALPIYKEYIQLNPYDAKGYIELGHCYTYSDPVMSKEANDCFVKAIELDPSYFYTINDWLSPEWAATVSALFEEDNSDTEEEINISLFEKNQSVKIENNLPFTPSLTPEQLNHKRIAVQREFTKEIDESDNEEEEKATYCGARLFKLSWANQNTEKSHLYACLDTKSLEKQGCEEKVIEKFTALLERGQLVKKANDEGVRILNSIEKSKLEGSFKGSVAKIKTLGFLNNTRLFGKWIEEKAESVGKNRSIILFSLLDIRAH